MPESCADLHTLSCQEGISVRNAARGPTQCDQVNPDGGRICSEDYTAVVSSGDRKTLRALLTRFAISINARAPTRLLLSYVTRQTVLHRPRVTKACALAISKVGILCKIAVLWSWRGRRITSGSHALTSVPVLTCSSYFFLHT